MTAEVSKQPTPTEEEHLVAWNDSDGAQTVPPTAPEARAVDLQARRYSAGHIAVGKYQLFAVLGDVALKLLRAELAGPA